MYMAMTKGIKNIQKVHEGEDYTRYSVEDDDNGVYEVEITGIARDIIDTLGEALLKESFIKKE